MSGEWWAALDPAEVPVECGGQTHRLRWAEGTLHAPDHADAEGERTLAALGGEPSRCVQLLDAWMRHSDDLDVLLLASRGASDPLAEAGGSAGPGRGGMSFMAPGAYRSRLRVQSASAVGWTSYAPLSGAVPGLAPVEPEQEVATLLGLGAGLPERLVAGVIAEWARRLVAGDERARTARAALQAALYGRALAVLRGWLADPNLDVELLMVGPDEPRSLSRDDAGLHLSLPFAWLGEVWAPGFATVLGRFCLVAEPAGSGASTDSGAIDDHPADGGPVEGWRLTVVDSGLGSVRIVILWLGDQQA